MAGASVGPAADRRAPAGVFSVGTCDVRRCRPAQSLPAQAIGTDPGQGWSASEAKSSVGSVLPASQMQLCERIRADIREVFTEVLATDRLQQQNAVRNGSSSVDSDKLLRQVLEQQQHVQLQIESLQPVLLNLVQRCRTIRPATGPAERPETLSEQTPLNSVDCTGGTGNADILDQGPRAAAVQANGGALCRQPTADGGVHQRYKPPCPCLERVITSIPFQVLCSVVIAVHGVWMSVHTQLSMAWATTHPGVGTSPELESVSFYFEIVFLAFYGVELILKLVCWRLRFFKGENASWNMFDMGLVAIGLLDVVKIGNSGAFVWLRILRVFKVLIRPLRAFRLVKFFQPLRVIMMSIMRSMHILVWAGLALGLVMFMVAMVFLQGLASFLQETPEADIPPETLLEIIEYWGTLGRGILTLYKAVTGGSPWGQFLNSVDVAGNIYHYLFLLYISVLVIAVLRMLTGIFVTTATETSKHDHEESVSHNLRTLFEEIDEDGSGCLTGEEFAKLLTNKKAMMYLNKLHISTQDAGKLFELLDTEGDNQISIDEFIGGCKKFSGFAKNIDMSMVITRVDVLSHTLELLMGYTEECFDAHFGNTEGDVPGHKDLSSRLARLKSGKSSAPVPASKSAANWNTL